MSTVPDPTDFGSRALKLWPVPLVVATALIAMLVAQRFGVTDALMTFAADSATAETVSVPGATDEHD